MALRDLARYVSPEADGFAPSTGIQERLRGTALQRFWNLIRLVAPDSVPNLRSYTGQWHVKLSLAATYAKGLWLIAAWLLAWRIGPLMVAAALVYSLGFLVWIVRLEVGNGPLLPGSIRTFRDLSEWISARLEQIAAGK